MNLVVLPILAACVFAFGYRYFGKLIDAIMGNKRQYNTAADHGAEVIESSRLSLWARFGTLGTPLLMVGSLYSLRAGWAPVFLWILLVATTIGALSVARRLRPVLPSPKPSLLNDGVTIAVSAALALLWAGLAAHSPHAVLGFMVFFFSAPRLATLLLSKNRLEQVGGGLFIIGLGLILAALGSIAPIGLSGPITLALGPWHLHTHSGALIAYAGLFLVILHKNRRGALTNYPTYGAIGSLLLACAGVVILVAVLLIHPTLTIPRLTTGSLGETIPILACAIPFGVALAPQPTRSTHAIRPQRAYLLTIFEGISGVGALVCLAFTFHNTMAWHDFFLTNPGPISLLRAAAAGGGALTTHIGIGAWLKELILISLLLLIAAAYESTQHRLMATTVFAPLTKKIHPIGLTMAVGTLWWLSQGLQPSDEVLAGGLLGIVSLVALLSKSDQLPYFMLSFGLILLVPIDAAFIRISWTDPMGHPLQTALTTILMTTEAAAAIGIWRTRSRLENHASRRPGNQS